MKAWIASIRLSVPVLVIGSILPLIYLVITGIRLVWTFANGAIIDWSLTLQNFLTQFAKLTLVGLVLAIAILLLVSVIARFEIRKNNQVKPK